ncbi:hypothetical protein AN618_08250 [Fervidicola ferrireducens]|uniref:Tryptophan synthase n=1 Tax=Fervidicola ferrireducens TaxID=520764 RepID=A0A140LB88_9FIRM|nr:hypothetical protein [Fervidicola ferrireducens]KXG77813.1 hypothetical protein AN618_08250 [Fervidicola ferrireducens]
MEEVKILLSERETPDYWYNIQADLPNPLKPPINPKTGEVISIEELKKIFPEELLKQEITQERYI